MAQWLEERWAELHPCNGWRAWSTSRRESVEPQARAGQGTGSPLGGIPRSLPTRSITSYKDVDGSSPHPIVVYFGFLLLQPFSVF